MYVPGPDGEPARTDFYRPRWDGDPTRAYYEYNNGPAARAPGMTAATHLHMGKGTPTGEGDASQEYNQFHLESPGICVGIKEIFSAGDVHISKAGIALDGGHAEVGQDGTWTTGTRTPLRIFIQEIDGTWTEGHWADDYDRQILDGESVLVTLGDYDDATIQGLQDDVKPPASRAYRLSVQESTMAGHPQGDDADTSSGAR